MNKNKLQEFSLGWVIASIFIFLAVELFLGGFIGEVVLGAYVSPMWHIKVMLLLNLASFLVGGFLVGFFSPGIRMLEPALAAFLSVLLTGMMKYFMPYGFWSADSSNLFVGGVIGFVLALIGAQAGERLMKNVD